jgi:predicted enzyme related to lactoylglutathione lyase
MAFPDDCVTQLQVAIGTDDVYKSAEAVELVTKELGGKILRQPGPLPGLNTKIASFLDPDGWKVVCLVTTLCITLLTAVFVSRSLFKNLAIYS